MNRVNDQVRKRQKIISNVTGDGEEYSIIWGMFMAVTMESASIHGKELLQNNRNSHCRILQISHLKTNV